MLTLCYSVINISKKINLTSKLFSKRRKLLCGKSNWIASCVCL